MGELVVDVISFQKIFGLCGLKCHIMEIWRDVTLVHGRTTDGRNVKIVLEFWKQNSQKLEKIEKYVSDCIFTMKGSNMKKTILRGFFRGHPFCLHAKFQV